MLAALVLLPCFLGQCFLAQGLSAQDPSVTLQQTLIDLDGAGLGFTPVFDMDGDLLAVGSGDGQYAVGEISIYERVGSTWNRVQELRNPTGLVGDLFGLTVSLSGTTLVVGAPYSDCGLSVPTSSDQVATGIVYIYEWSGSEFVGPQLLKPNDVDAADQFGWSASIDGNRLLVGAPWEDGGGVGVGGDSADNSGLDTGAAYLFERRLGVWVEVAYLKSLDPDGGDCFGKAVALKGPLAVVGVRHDASASLGTQGNPTNNQAPLSGAAYVYSWRAGLDAPVQIEAFLKPSNQLAEAFGEAVATDGVRILVGAPNESAAGTGVNGDQLSVGPGSSYSGSAYLFERNVDTGAWSQSAYLKPSNTSVCGNFGDSVSIEGGVLLIGAHTEYSVGMGVNGDQYASGAQFGASGAAYQFRESATGWAQQSFIKAHDSEASLRFGRDVLVHGNLLLIGDSRGFGRVHVHVGRLETPIAEPYSQGANPFLLSASTPRIGEPFQLTVDTRDVALQFAAVGIFRNPAEIGPLANDYWVLAGPHFPAGDLLGFPIQPGPWRISSCRFQARRSSPERSSSRRR